MRPVSLDGFSLRARLLLTSAALALAGLAVIGIAVVTTHHAPRPSAAAATAPVGPTSSALPSASTTAARPHSSAPGRSRPSSHPVAVRHDSLPPAGNVSPLPVSTPLQLRVPAAGVTSSLMQLGLNQDGSVEVPPLSDVQQAGWYRFSATPGSAGSAVVLGHVDSAAYGQGVFFDLGALRPGDEADVIRADGTTAVFRIDRVAEFPKSSFPSKLVYGPTSYASLKLVTCGGRFDSSTGNYLDNIVAFGTLTAHR